MPPDVSLAKTRLLCFCAEQGRPRMASYDEFSSRTLGRLRTERKAPVCGGASGQREALSTIRFHGRAVLAPLLSVDQRREMTRYRQKAAQLEADRLRRAHLLARVQDIIDSVQPPKPEAKNGFALLPNLSSPPWGPRDREAQNADPPGAGRSLAQPSAMGEECEEREEEEEEEEEGRCGGRSLSLQALLRRSRAYLEREQGHRGGSWGRGARGAPPQAESLSDKENESSVPPTPPRRPRTSPHPTGPAPSPPGTPSPPPGRRRPAQPPRRTGSPNARSSGGGLRESGQSGARLAAPSYDVESPSPTLQRPHVTSDPAPAPSLAKHQSDLEGSPELSPVNVSLREQNRTTEEVQRRVSALEEVRRQMQEDHAQQLSLLIAEQEKEQQRLRQALGDSLITAEPSPAHSTGCPSVFSPAVPLPASHSPVFRWGPSCGKSRSRLNPVIPPELQGALCRLSALARGFLTRRLLNTEKLKHLRQTVLDTREFIHSFLAEGPLKRAPCSVQDACLQERLRAQLRAALYDVHDVFFVMSLGERLLLLRQDRELRAERRLREMNKGRSPRERAVLSAATQRSLDRRKQRVSVTPGQSRRAQAKPKSPPINRVLQPIQGSNAPLPGQPLRHGSLNRTNPEERLKRAGGLKKHTL
ncbi:hypothetical protein COCON_G00023150 [Conger conger]|uniref:Centriolar coiled coil protein 110kDa n=1 Tax=Conger conger TaxID=82655 RepID=A0A9Q1DX85_CONCO|nr:hypothetical protein COCON_G00023150 [Conger conger]